MQNPENICYGRCGQPVKVSTNPDFWEVVVDYYPESRSFIPYYFEAEKEAISFCNEWKQNEMSRIV